MEVKEKKPSTNSSGKGLSIEEKRKARPDAWDYYENILGSPKHFVAPMVDGSVLPFRLLCKRHGADIGVTPMIYR